MNVLELPNRPMLRGDFVALRHREAAAEIRALVADYRRAALPVMNGSFAFSNLVEGADQILTCHPYRLWEYVSILDAIGTSRPTFLEVGGAGSPLPYVLAERPRSRGTRADRGANGAVVPSRSHTSDRDISPAEWRGR